MNENVILSTEQIELNNVDIGFVKFDINKNGILHNDKNFICDYTAPVISLGKIILIRSLPSRLNIIYPLLVQSPDKGEFLHYVLITHICQYHTTPKPPL